jgi:solute carrier family 25 phosphate transporter 23/24/25/41
MEFKTYVIDKYKELHQLFNECDTNHDGIIDRQEVELMLERMNMSHTKRDLDRLMQVIDIDQSGTIDFHEWSTLLMMLPVENIRSVFQYWREAAALDYESGLLRHPKTTNTTSVLVHLMAGAFSGAIAKTGTAPFERLKLYGIFVEYLDE